MTDREIRSGEGPGPSLLLGGDVMLGRGVDQILAFPGSPELHEPYVRDARDYVGFAEEAGGVLPRRVDPGYPWGALLEEFGRERGQVNLVNLETALTTRDEYCRGKGIHYPRQYSSRSEE